MSFVILAGHPRPQSRTRQIAQLAADAVIRAAGLPPGHQVVDLFGLQRRLLLVASPTYKGTYTGLLKVFLDRLDYQALSGVTALPTLVMRLPQHTLAVDVHLRPLLTELGAAVPAPGLAFLESDLDRAAEVLDPWAARVAAALGRAAALIPPPDPALSR